MSKLMILLGVPIIPLGLLVALSYRGRKLGWWISGVGLVITALGTIGWITP